MASSYDATKCTSCGQKKTIYKCPGCERNFCFNDLAEHRRELGKQLHDIEDQRNYLREILLEQKKNPDQHPLIEKINQWEYESIERIKRMAEEHRRAMKISVIGQVDRVEMKLETLTDQLKEIRKQDDFNEIILDNLRRELKELEDELNKFDRTDIHFEDLASMTKKLSLTVPSPRMRVPKIDSTTKWKQNGITVVGGNGEGGGLNQIALPWAICFDDEGSMYVAEERNHRIVKWKVGAKMGQIVAGGNGCGDRNDQLYSPKSVVVDSKNSALIIADTNNSRIVRWPLGNGTGGETVISNVQSYGLFMDSNDDLYVCDEKKGEVRRWKIGEKQGTLVAGGNGDGSHLNQLSAPSNIFVDQDHSIYVSDWRNHRVVKWPKGAREGIVVAGGNGQGSNLAQLSRPYGIFVDKAGSIYVADKGNNRIIRWLKGAREGSVVVGGNGEGNNANQFNVSMNLSLDQYNNLYVVDYRNHRIQKFEVDS